VTWASRATIQISTGGPTRALGCLILAAMPIFFVAQTSALGDKLSPVVDNARVTVFDVTLKPGTSWQAPEGVDFAEMILEGGELRTTTASGQSITASHKRGEVLYAGRGKVSALEAGSKDPVRVIIVELKDPGVLPLPNNSGYPLAFPRAGAKKVFENDRVIGWNSDWALGTPTVIHYHDKDVVVVFMDSGSIKSTPLEGESTIGDVNFGTIRFSKSDRTHSEELVKGKASAIVLELKS
jgi:hypothetical protein